MKQHFAARLTLSAFAILLAIAPVPFEKWAWQRIAFGILGLIAVTSTKNKIDEEMDEQRLVDVQVFEEKQYERELTQVQQGLAIEAARQQEAVRFDLQTKVMTADYQGAFVALMEEKHPYYLDALEAQQKAALQAQERAYSAEGGTATRIGEVLEIGAIGFETGVSLENGIQQSSVPKYLRSFVATTCLAWGAQGSGKSWFVRYLTKIKVDKGYLVIVFDPNSNHSSWKGVELINTYEAIEEKMRWYINEVQLRYQTFTQSDYDEDVWRAGLWTDGKAISVICEEVTTYADFIPDTELVKQFIKVATTLSRKQEMPVTFVTHNNTQTCFGNIKGLGQLIADMQQIKLIPKTDSETDQPVASGRAQVRSNSEQSWVDVAVPRIASKIIDFTRTPQGSSTQNQAPVAEVNTTKTIDNAAAEAQDAVDSIAHIDTQRQQLDAGYKQLNLAEYLRNETTPEELDKLIEGLRSGDTTRIDDVSDTSEPKSVSDAYQSPEALPEKEPSRIWEVSDFKKYLPNHEELVLFEELCSYQDTSRAGSEIIKKAWKFSSGGAYRRVGQPCFAYIVNKHGSEAQKKFYASFIEKCLAVNDSDSE
ncbi:DUF87 domain-containing protein [Microcoleus sp. herbarium7]|uniref:helicase HerA domain-containing protein n=1 Tax=Microcoleus sp. herbarium7 TaxID=3055435 RepID=UPI002FD3475A